MKPIKNLRALNTKRLYEMLEELENEKPDINLNNPDMIALNYLFMLDFIKKDILKELKRRGELK